MWSLGDEIRRVPDHMTVLTVPWIATKVALRLVVWIAKLLDIIADKT